MPDVRKRLSAAAAVTLSVFVTGTLRPQALPTRYAGADGRTRVAIVAMPYHGERNVPEQSGSPAYLLAGNLDARLVAAGAVLTPLRTVELTVEEQGQYGTWRRMGLANAHLARMVAENERSGALTVGLLANCTSVLGVLAGLQHPGPGESPRKVGLVFIDAHGDFNTPETTLSGMLGGMPVAVSAGLALHNLRRGSGLEPPIPTGHIALAAVRDLDPLEAALVTEHRVERLSVADIRARSDRLGQVMDRLSRETDLIYVHIDMDVLDPSEVPGHPLTVPDGPTSAELGAALMVMFGYAKVAALGIASTPSGERDPEGVSRQAAYRLIDGALEGVRRR